VIKEKLLSLSTGELIKLAEHHAIAVDDDTERTALITLLYEELLLELNNKAINAYLKRYLFDNYTKNDGPVFNFPKQYHEQTLYFLLRDPYWVFVYWEIEEKVRLTSLAANNFRGFFLRLSSLTEGEDGVNFEHTDVTIDASAVAYGQQFIQLASPEKSHSLALFADFDGVEAMIMVSQLIPGINTGMASTNDDTAAQLCGLS